MKSAIVAIVLLTTLVAAAGIISVTQENALSPVYKKIEALPDRVSEMNSKKREESRETLEKALKEFEKKSFVVEIGIPHEEAERVHTLMEKALIFLDAGEDTQFLTHVEEARVYLKALKNYGKASFENIT